MSQNFLPEEVKEPEIQKHQTYITDVQVGLARHEIEQPTGEHNTELEEAMINFKRVSEELRQTQHEHSVKMQDIAIRRKALDNKLAELKAREQEMQQQQQRQKERDEKTEKTMERKRADISREMEQISALTDQVAGAQALLRVLRDRNARYRVYSDFILQIHAKMNPGEQRQQEAEALSDLEKQQQDLLYRQRCLKEVSNRFILLQQEQIKSDQVEQNLNKQYDELTQKLKQQTEDHRARITQIE